MDVSIIQNGTKKEQNRRLLLDYHTSYVQPEKVRKFNHPSKYLRHVKRQQEIKEENLKDVKHQNIRKGSQITQVNKSEQEEGNDDNRRQQIRQTLKRKVKISKGKKRKIQSKAKMVRPSEN